jgi:hypothetical protein
MSEFMLDSGHHWMRDCDQCGGWHHCSAPKDEDSVDDWECPTCVQHERVEAAANATLQRKDELIRELAEALVLANRRPKDPSWLTTNEARQIADALRRAGRL